MGNDVETHVARIDEIGYTVVEAAIDLGFVDALNEDLLRLERDLRVEPAHNSFEGFHTVRIYNLLAHGPNFEQVPVHPAVLPICERVLDPGLLVSSLSSIAIDSGESAQGIHADDQLIPLAKPHEAIICNTMWALTDFTESNGATRLIPGSHKADNSPDLTQAYDTVAAEMPKGSVLIWHGSLWHGGGANRTSERRVGIAMNYCAGFIRQQENQQLGISRETARHFSPRLQELIGYGLYHGLIGHIDKSLPATRLLGAEQPPSLVWDYVGEAAD
jgi:ectoine hydroxylase-related dioxygenase (phytanoyl-CoA dioxygenase family)